MHNMYTRLYQLFDSAWLVGFNYIAYIMPFWTRKKKQATSKEQEPASKVVIMESDLLGMTVIEEENTQTSIQEL